MTRRAARRAAVDILYAADVRQVEALEVAAEDEDVREYTQHLVEGVSARRAEIDALLTAHSTGWAPDRMSPVDRNILRVGVLELLECDVPPAAVIDEAVETAKHLSGEEACRFVNAVLDAVRRGRSGEGA